MSTTVFDFQAVGSMRYPSPFDTYEAHGNDGVVVSRPDTGVWGVYRADFTVQVPGPGIATGTTKTLADWVAFVRARQGAYDSWLWKDPFVPALYQVTTSDTDGAVGTGNGTTKTFSLAHVHVQASTLLVYVNAVLQTLTTDYTLVDNDTAPYVNFVTAPGAGLAVTVAYDFYHPVKFTVDPPIGDWLKTTTNFRSDVSIEEIYAGAHRVA